MRSRWLRLPPAEPENAAALSGGGAAGGSCHRAAAGTSRGRAAPRPLARGTCPGDRPATSLEGALLKIRTKIQSESVSGCAKWPGNFPSPRGGPGGEGAQTARSAGGAARPGPRLPPLTQAPRAAGLGGARRGRGRTPVGRPGQQRGGGRAQGAPRPAERSAGSRASMCVLAAAGALTARAPHPRGPARARGRGRPGGGGGGPSGPGRA